MSQAPRAESLSHYEYTSLYEATFRTRREDVEFFCEIADKFSGPILEYGAGAGRVTIPLAKRGHEVTAVDASQAMVTRLKSHLKQCDPVIQSRVTVRKGDMRRLSLGQKFPLVFATFNVIAHLEKFEDMGLFLRRAQEHLAPGGHLVFDVPIPHPDEVEADPEELHKVPRFKHPETKEWIRQTERFEYFPARQVLLVESELKPEGARDGVTIPLVLRQWFPKELESILKYEGFKHIETFADYTPQPGLLARDTLIYQASLKGR